MPKPSTERSDPAATINLINSKTHHWEQFEATGPIPSYFALSYCWRSPKRQLLETFYDPRAILQPKSFPGLAKVCEAAVESGVDSVWVDTCCIVGTTDRELAAAINSKFRRYRESKLCFVYLDDLDGLGNAEATLCESRWFTCAWTLQGLIAAREIQFYDRRWEFLGSKRALLATLSKHTEIDSRVLADAQCLSDVPVGTRMSWAARRKARREEDRAYSLLGLFGLHMTITYGEGGKAFRRLQKKISHAFDDSSLLAWQSPGAKDYHGLMAESPAGFAHYLEPQSAEPLIIQVALQLRRPEGQVHGVFVIQGGRPGHLLLDVSGHESQSGPEILLRRWRGRFLRVRPHRILKLSELPGDYFQEMARRVGSLPIRLNHGNSVSGPENLTPAPNKSHCLPRDSSSTPHEDDRRFNTTTPAGQETDSSPVPGSPSSPTGMPADNEPSEDVPPRPLSEPRGGNLNTSDDSDEFLEDSDESEYDSSDSSDTDDDVKLLTVASLDTPKFDHSHLLFDQLEGATTFALSAYLNSLSSRSSPGVKRRPSTTPSSPTKRPRLGSNPSTSPSTPSPPLAGKDEPRDSPKPGPTPSQQATGSSLLACPFYLLDPIKHQPCLARPHPADIPALVQHLAQTHRRPETCPRCGAAFTTASACDGHIRAGTCQVVPSLRLGGVTPAQVRQLARLLRARDHADATTAERWYAVWEVVVPWEARAASPWVPARAEPLVALVQSARGFWAARGERDVWEFLRNSGLRQEGPAASAGEVRAMGAVVLQRLVELLADLFRQGSDDEGRVALEADAVAKVLAGFRRRT